MARKHSGDFGNAKDQIDPDMYAALDGESCTNTRLNALLQEANALGVRFDKNIPAVAGMRRMEAATGSV